MWNVRPREDALQTEIYKYAKNVQDLIAEIIHACIYQDEPTAASGKYGLPKKCWDDMELLSKYSHDICDGINPEGGEQHVRAQPNGNLHIRLNVILWR